MSMSEILSNIHNASETDDCFIIAATINLYSESLRRKAGRILYGDDDVRNLFAIANLLLHTTPTQRSYAPPKRSPEPNEQEMEDIQKTAMRDIQEAAKKLGVYKDNHNQIAEKLAEEMKKHEEKLKKENV